MNDEITQGLQFYEKGDFETAAPLLARGIERMSDEQERERLRIRLASAYDELGRYPEALAELKAVLEENASSAGAWNNIGVICGKLDRLDDARMAFEKAYRIDPSNAEHLINLGSICLKLSDPGNALQYLLLAIELVPGHPAAHANLALTYAVFGRLEEAEDALRLAILYGFAQADAIQQKIDALKNVRERLLTEHENDGSAQVKDEDSTQTQSGGETELLLSLEKEMHALAETRYGGDAAASEAELAERMQVLRKSIRALRRNLGLEEVTDSDVVSGIHYMRDEADSG
ncbi:MAG: tetratricopeptide repeat protein [Bacteroidetes bacterium]|nr:tetratricopeptide repeat protein [Bacteroidota bacterium]